MSSLVAVYTVAAIHAAEKLAAAATAYAKEQSVENSVRMENAAREAARADAQLTVLRTQNL